MACFYHVSRLFAVTQMSPKTKKKGIFYSVYPAIFNTCFFLVKFLRQSTSVRACTPPQGRSDTTLLLWSQLFVFVCSWLWGQVDPFQPWIVCFFLVSNTVATLTNRLMNKPQYDASLAGNTKRVCSSSGDWNFVFVCLVLALGVQMHFNGATNSIHLLLPQLSQHALHAVCTEITNYQLTLS